MKIINSLYATVTTHRSNSASAFFNCPTDATPQDCKEITGRLIKQAQAVIAGIDRSNPKAELLYTQLNLVTDLLLQASAANQMLDIDQAIAMAQVEG